MSLAQHLEREQQHLDAFIALLEAERASLSQGEVDGERLSTQAQQKQHHMERLETLETQRRNVLKKLGYGQGRQGAEAAARLMRRSSGVGGGIPLVPPGSSLFGNLGRANSFPFLAVS